MRRPRLCLASTDSEALRGCRPGPLRGSATEMAGRGQASGGKPSCRKAAKSPEERSLSHKSRDGASERRFFYYHGASFGAPSPLKAEGRELKAQLARRRE